MSEKTLLIKEPEPTIKQLELEGSVVQTKAEFILDTGAVSNFISSSTVHKLDQTRFEILQNQTRVQLADGSISEILGQIKLDITLD